MNRFLVHYTAADRLREIENELKIERGRRPARQGDIISQVSSMNIPEDEIEFSGVVSGETNIGNDIIAILKNMIKGEIRKYPDDEGSMDRMMDNARKFDAEAVIRY